MITDWNLIAIAMQCYCELIYKQPFLPESSHALDLLFVSFADHVSHAQTDLYAII